jgi:hypothetical protein
MTYNGKWSRLDIKNGVFLHISFTGVEELREKWAD